MFRRRQRGITLVVSLIMLVVLTLIVVSAIQFGNINLKISGNAQAEAEATAATQVGIEKMIKEVNAATKIDLVNAQPAMAVSTGGASYTVNVKKPACVLTSNIVTTELDPSNEKDVPCYEGDPTEKLFDSNGKPIAQPTACKKQHWEIEATVDDAKSGAKVSMLQGVAVRVPAQVACL
jgi:Tfp pilus assembly protein PilV